MPNQRMLALLEMGCLALESGDFRQAGVYFRMEFRLFSCALPAQVAGVREIVAACPGIDAAVAAPAVEAGVSRIRPAVAIGDAKRCGRVLAVQLGAGITEPTA